MTSTDGNWRWWKRLLPYLAPGVIFLGLAVILGDMAAVSFEHEYQLAHGNGQAGWESAGLAVSVDGLLAVASVAIIWAMAHGLRGPVQLWRPYLALAVGIAATIAANLYSGLHYIWLQRAVSVWSGVAVALAAEVVMWFTGARRRLASGEPLQPAPACAHPPPPVSLAGALPLAREELRSRGELWGEEALAERFGVTRHQVRKALATADAGGAAPSSRPPVSAAGAVSSADLSRPLANGSGPGA